MKVAITGAGGYLGRALVGKLDGVHEVYPSDLGVSERGLVRADVLDVEAMNRLCAGVDRVVHLACVSPGEDRPDPETETRVLDTRLKGTYNVMKAALEAGVRQVVQVSDLCIFSGYGLDRIVSEDFVPLPDMSAHQQSIYLSEWIGREFARLQPGFVLTLRLGRLVDVQTLSPEARFDPEWLDLSDAVDAIARGLELETYDSPSDWGLYNLASKHPDSRFALAKIASGRYGFEPAEDFHAWWGREETV